MQYHNSLDSLTFFQTAAENEALYRQCFALAGMTLELAVKRAAAGNTPKERLYIVCDLDETLLDNSEFNVWLARTGRDFHASTWSAWCQEEKAMATAGALSFLHSAESSGVQIYYVSSRFEADRAATASNLEKLHFPLPDASDDPAKTRLFLDEMKIDGTPTKKLQQFSFLEKRLGAPLLKLGDNLSDLEAARYARNVRFDQRVANIREDASRLAVDWIVFPNPIYGAWRDTLKLKTSTSDLPIKDEINPVPYQADPVRPPVPPEEAPKMKLLSSWKT